MKLESYIITLNRPYGMTKAEMKTYIEDAVRSMCGGCQPDEPIFDLDRSTVSVRSMGAATERKASDRAQKLTDRDLPHPVGRCKEPSCCGPV